MIRNDKKLFDKIPVSFIEETWGLVLSINVMSQLPLHIGAYIKKKLKKKYTTEEITHHLQLITKNHLLYLENFKCPVLLVTDIETLYFDKQEGLLQLDVNYPHLNLPIPDRQWLWNVAPIPEFDKTIGMKMKVAAFIINSQK